jgi:hypothetical protein
VTHLDPPQLSREAPGQDVAQVHRYDQTWMHDFMRTTFDRCLAISKAKSNDYAGKEHPFKNFALVAELGLCSTEVGIVVRIGDKISRLSTLIRKPDQRSVVDETIQDTIDDAINYLAILGAYLAALKERRNKEVLSDTGCDADDSIPSPLIPRMTITPAGEALMSKIFPGSRYDADL